MNEVQQPYDNKSWWVWYGIVLIGLWIVAWFNVGDFDALLFNSVTHEIVLELLLPVLALAIFIERAVEVYVNTNREPGKVQLEAEVAARSADASTMDAYRMRTRQKAFLVALTLGTLVALVGVRVLYPLVNADFALEGLQGQLFGMVDVVITAAMLAGGAEPIHKMMMALTGFLDQIRPTRASRSTPNSNK